MTGAVNKRRTNKMRTIRIKLHKFSELSKAAKQRAIEDWRNQDTEIFWKDENRESMEKFANIFQIKVTDWSYGGRGEGVSFQMEYDHEEIETGITGQRLATYIWNNYRSQIYSRKWYNGTIRTKPNKYHLTNPAAPEFTTFNRYSNIQIEDYNCPLTGYCMDNEILDPIWQFLKKPRDINFKELLQECFDAWVKACNADIEYQNSDESISETLEANEYEFTKAGQRYP